MKATLEKANEDNMSPIELSRTKAIAAAETGSRLGFAQLLLSMSLEERENVMTLLLTTAGRDLEFILWVNELDINKMTHKTDKLLNTIVFTQGYLTNAISAETLPHSSTGVAQAPVPPDSSHLNTSSSLSSGTTGDVPAVMQIAQAAVQVSQVQSTAVTESREQGL